MLILVMSKTGVYKILKKQTTALWFLQGVEERAEL